jgi:hypothetical protein
MAKYPLETDKWQPKNIFFSIINNKEGHETEPSRLESWKEEKIRSSENPGLKEPAFKD